MKTLKKGFNKLLGKRSRNEFLILDEETNLVKDVEVLWNQIDDSDLRSLDLFTDEYDCDAAGFISTDLSEATYSTPFEVLELNNKFLDEILIDCVIWRVYRELFHLMSREVDTTQLYEKGYTTITSYSTSRGGFMGDPLSFVNLTLQMQATLNMALKRTEKRSQDQFKRPLGQGAGDDSFLMGAKRSLYKNLKQCFVDTGMSLSKIDTWSPDAMTFCEQYSIVPSDLKVIQDYSAGSVFHDVFYLDIIKGSLLSGKSKVKTVGSSPFLGHASALNKQLEWHPIKWVKERAPVLLWAANYNSSKKLASNSASLPRSLGGFDLAIGKKVEFNDTSFQRKLPYYEAILDKDFDEFLPFSILLAGIYMSNPKGTIWENKFEEINEFTQRCEIFAEREVTKNLPSYLNNKGYGATRRYLSENLGLVSLRELLAIMARRDAYLKIWLEEEQSTYMSLPLKGIKEKLSSCWKTIYNEVDPVKETSFTSIRALSKAFDNKVWGFLIKKDDPVYAELFDGMPSLYLDYNSTIYTN